MKKKHVPQVHIRALREGEGVLKRIWGLGGGEKKKLGKKKLEEKQCHLLGRSFKLERYGRERFDPI